MLQENELKRYDGCILCPRLELFDNIQKELEKGTVIGFLCATEKASAEKFKRLYEDATKTKMVIGSSRCSPNSPFLAYKADLRCHRNVPAQKSRKSSARDLGCPWKISMVCKTRSLMSRKRDEPLGCCGLVVRGFGHHNHTTDISTAIKHRQEQPEIVFLVPSSDGSSAYTVDLSNGSCSCAGFLHSGTCRHVTAVDRVTDDPEPADRGSATAEKKSRMCFVGTDRRDMPTGGFDELRPLPKDSEPAPDSPSVPRAGTQPVSRCSNSDDSTDSLTRCVSLAASPTPSEPVPVTRSYDTEIDAVTTSLRTFTEEVTATILNDVAAHPDQASAWTKALDAFLADWRANSTSTARQSQLYAQRRLRLRRNAATIPVSRTERRQASRLRAQRRVQPARPPKPARSDHPYKTKQGMRISAAPESLQACVDKNGALKR